MSKFKVGDKVKIIKLFESCDKAKVGEVGIVRDICDDEYPIRVDIKKQLEYGFKEDELEVCDEPITTSTTFKLSDRLLLNIYSQNEDSYIIKKINGVEILLTEKDMESICYEFIQHQRRKFSRQGRS